MQFKGKTLTQLAQELEYINNNAKDTMAHPSLLHMNTPGQLIIGSKEAVEPTSWSHQQIATYTDIPKNYYDRMRDESPHLLAQNVNTWLHQKGLDSSERRLLRTVGGKLRGFLSSRYRVIDSYDLLNTILPILKEKNFQIVSCELTDKRLYIKAVLPNMTAAVKPGDVVNLGIIISNSEVGAGMFRIEPYAVRLLCTNGMISDAAIKKYHVGRDNGTDEMLSILSDETMQATDEALMLQVRDVLLAATDPEGLFREQINLMRDAAERKIENYQLVEVVKKATTKMGFTSKLVRENILANLANGNEGAGLTMWGLANSFTAAAKLEGIGYDESVDLERAGGKILTLSQNDWKAIAS